MGQSAETSTRMRLTNLLRLTILWKCLTELVPDRKLPEIWMITVTIFETLAFI